MFRCLGFRVRETNAKAGNPAPQTQNRCYVESMSGLQDPGRRIREYYRRSLNPVAGAASREKSCTKDPSLEVGPQSPEPRFRIYL